MVREHGHSFPLPVDLPQIRVQMLHGHYDAAGASRKAASPVGFVDVGMTARTQHGQDLQFTGLHSEEQGCIQRGFIDSILNDGERCSRNDIPLLI